jgi:hypothetical protein
MADQQILHDFEELIRKEVPEFKTGAKDSSWVMKLCGFLARPFNDSFMTRFTTTWGTTVYFPTKEGYEKDSQKSIRILAHEFVHLYDHKKHWWFQLSYIFPQVLALIPMVVFGVLAWPWSWLVLGPLVAYLLACVIALGSRVVALIFLALALVGFCVGGWALVGWKLLILLGALLFVIPWPAPWRTKWELRGYSMNVAFAVWWGYWTPAIRDQIALNFTGPNYFFMCWSSSKIRAALDQAAEKAQAGEIQRETPYSTVHDFLYQRRLLGS